MKTQILINFVRSVLDDSHGINQKAFENLQILANECPDLEGILTEVEACENRYFLPETD